MRLKFKLRKLRKLYGDTIRNVIQEISLSDLYEMGYEVRPDYIPREAIRMVWKKRNKLNWHISSVVSRNDTGKLEVTSYAHLFDACTQDWFAIVSMLENLLVTVKAGRPIFFVAYLRWDEVGY